MTSYKNSDEIPAFFDMPSNFAIDIKVSKSDGKNFWLLETCSTGNVCFLQYGVLNSS